MSQPTNQRPARASQLLQLKEADIGELYEIRRLLEGEFAALAAERRTRAQLAEMSGAIEAEPRRRGPTSTPTSASTSVSRRRPRIVSPLT